MLSSPENIVHPFPLTSFSHIYLKLKIIPTFILTDTREQTRFEYLCYYQKQTHLADASLIRGLLKETRWSEFNSPACSLCHYNQSLKQRIGFPAPAYKPWAFFRVCDNDSRTIRIATPSPHCHFQHKNWTARSDTLGEIQVLPKKVQKKTLLRQVYTSLPKFSESSKVLRWTYKMYHMDTAVIQRTHLEHRLQRMCVV